MGMAGVFFGNQLPSDQETYMPHICRVLGHVEGISTTTVLELDEVGPMTTTLQQRFPGNPALMKLLLYRRSRDGWTGEAFHSRCGDTTIVKTGLIDLAASDAEAMSAESYNDDIRCFGVSIADSLMEERVALHYAHVELAKANAKAAASVQALVALYGQEVAAKKEGAAVVVELSVRGTRMTTLRSTLQACPNSAFAARFDEDKWPPTEKDVDEHGRRVINDCSPSVFSKVLDVLRVRKRMGWASDGGNGESDVRVVVKAADREAFKEFVHMYFTDHESFIMDLVQTP